MISVLTSAWSLLDYRTILALKVAVAAAGALVLMWELLPSSASGSPDHSRRTRDWLLGGLAAASLLSWWNFGHFHFPDYLQVHEHYHYYLGSKYFAELGYTRLYDCTAVADVEEGLAREVSGRWVRNLATNVLERGDRIVRNPGECTSHFSRERWDMFKRDVAWFRAHRSSDGWRLSQIDHGYNATPVWGIAGRLLAETGPPSMPRLTLFSLLDPLLLAVMWAFVYWAFGWRVMCVTLIFWGTYYPDRFTWTGGAFLRADWLALSTIGICLVKRGWMATGGFALTFAALLRIFPGFIIAALGLKALVSVWRARRFGLEPSVRRFAAGCALALVLLVPLSAAVIGGGVNGGIEAWHGFIANSEKHLSTALTNNMGLKVLMSYDTRSRIEAMAPYWLDTPWDTWYAARQAVFKQREPLFWILVGLFVPLLAFAVHRRDDWSALVLGVAFVPVALQLTCYYYAVLLIFGLLYEKTPWVGIALCALSAASGLVLVPLDFDDDVYAILSVLALAFVTAVVADAAWHSRLLLKQTLRSQVGPQEVASGRS